MRTHKLHNLTYACTQYLGNVTKQCRELVFTVAQRARRGPGLPCLICMLLSNGLGSATVCSMMPIF